MSRPKSQRLFVGFEISDFSHGVPRSPRHAGFLWKLDPIRSKHGFQGYSIVMIC